MITSRTYYWEERHLFRDSISGGRAEMPDVRTRSEKVRGNVNKVGWCKNDNVLMAYILYDYLNII